jgi:predicted RNase H-like nuclease (RuvC/YqgF family)
VLTVTATIKSAAAATKALDDLVNNIKQLARDAGLPQLWIWIGSKRVKAEEITGNDLEDLVAEED